MTFGEAIKRLRQETAPATYCPDFDKEECLKVIETEFKKYKKAFEIVKVKLDLGLSELGNTKLLTYCVDIECCYYDVDITEEQNNILMEVLNDDSKHNEEEKERS